MSGKPGRSGGARPGAGRKSNAQKLIEAVQAKLATPPAAPSEPPPERPPVLVGAYDTPEAFLLAVMRHDLIDMKLRIDAAKALQAAERAKAELKGKKAERQDAADTEAATGPFSAGAPPRLVSSR